MDGATNTVTNSVVHYFHHDQLGSTRALTDANGHPIATYKYTPYGQALSNNTSTANPLLYDGQYTDQESGLQYLRARYYDSATGQFVTRDPIEVVTRQPYVYAADNPVSHADPTGLWFGIDDAIASGAGAVVGATVSVGEQIASGQGIDLGKVAIAAGSGAAGGEAALYCGPGCGGAVAGGLNDLGNQINDNGRVNPVEVAGAAVVGGALGAFTGGRGVSVPASAGTSAVAGFYGDWTIAGTFGNPFGPPGC